MKCKECTELLVDYMHGELSSEVRALVKEHLSSCSACSKEFEEYTEIRMVAQGEELPEVSYDVLARISKAANDDLNKARKPFWKKWSYSPVLVPALTTAIALSVWFYYGYDAVNIVPEANYSSREVTYETQAEAMKSQSDNIEGDEGTVIEDAVVLDKRTDVPEEETISKSAEKPQDFEYEMMPAPPPEPEILSSPEFAEESGSSNLRMQKEGFAVARQKKKEDKCDVSIRTNEAIINSTPPASLTAQQKSYKELAQCYEQTGDYNNAISNYMNLRQVAPEESSFANSRIQEIRKRIKLENGQQLSNPVPAN